jgi:hypothetical protein
MDNIAVKIAISACVVVLAGVEQLLQPVRSIIQQK